MSESPVRVVFSDRPITCAEVAANGRRIKAERARIKCAQWLLDAVESLAMWVAGFAPQRHVAPRRVRRRKGLPLIIGSAVVVMSGRRVRVRVTG